MSEIDKQYKELLKEILTNGYKYQTDNRKNIICKQIDSYTIKHDFKDGFPLLSLKKIPFNLVISELLWFLRGKNTLDFLHENDNYIWDADANTFFNNEKHRVINVGKAYGSQWRHFTKAHYSNGLDQIKNLVMSLRTDNPITRRHIVIAWNPLEISRESVALPPCHWSFEVIVRPLASSEKCFKFSEYGFTLKWHQRSVDTYLGLPFNIASYALLALLIERWTGHKALGIIGDLSNVHLYDNSWGAAIQLLGRDEDTYESPSVFLSNEITKDSWKLEEITKLKVEDVKLVNYFAYENIKVKMLAQDIV